MRPSSAIRPGGRSSSSHRCLRARDSRRERSDRISRSRKPLNPCHVSDVSAPSPRPPSSRMSHTRARMVSGDRESAVRETCSTRTNVPSLTSVTKSRQVPRWAPQTARLGHHACPVAPSVAAGLDAHRPTERWRAKSSIRAGQSRRHRGGIARGWWSSQSNPAAGPLPASHDAPGHRNRSRPDLSRIHSRYSSQAMETERRVRCRLAHLGDTRA